MTTTLSLAPAELPADAVEVWRVADAWGIKGWFKVLSHSSSPQAMFSAKTWFLQPSERGPRAFAGAVLLPIRQVKDHSDTVVAWAEGIDDRSAAEALRGARIFIPRSSFPATTEDEYYWVDLIGCQVFSEGKKMGIVQEVLDNGAHAILRVERFVVSPDLPTDSDADPIPMLDAKGRPQEVLVPFVATHVQDVDILKRRIETDWPFDL